MSFSASSQNKWPRIQLIDTDTCFCFTVSQARQIASDKERLNQCNDYYENSLKEISLLSGVIVYKDSVILNLDANIESYKEIDRQRQVQIGSYEEEIKLHKQEIKALKWQRFGLIVVSASALVLLAL